MRQLGKHLPDKPDECAITHVSCLALVLVLVSRKLISALAIQFLLRIGRDVKLTHNPSPPTTSVVEEGAEDSHSHQLLTCSVSNWPYGG